MINGKPFFSLINWKILTPNSFKFKGSCGKCKRKTNVDALPSCSESCVNYDCQVACEHDSNCGEACGSKRTTEKKVKYVTVLKTKEKRLDLKSEEKCCKDDCANENIGLVAHEEKLPELFDKCRNQRVPYITSLERKSY